MKLMELQKKKKRTEKKNIFDFPILVMRPSLLRKKRKIPLLVDIHGRETIDWKIDAT